MQIACHIFLSFRSSFKTLSKPNSPYSYSIETQLDQNSTRSHVWPKLRGKNVTWKLPIIEQNRNDLHDTFFEFFDRVSSSIELEPYYIRTRSSSNYLYSNSIELDLSIFKLNRTRIISIQTQSNSKTSIENSKTRTRTRTRSKAMSDLLEYDISQFLTFFLATGKYS